MGHGNNLVIKFGIISDLFVCDDQSSSAISTEESWSSVDPKGSKFAQWFHFEGMKRTPINVIFYSLTISVCCVLCVHVQMLILQLRICRCEVKVFWTLLTFLIFSQSMITWHVSKTSC
jgi:hypothetical protein